MNAGYLPVGGSVECGIPFFVFLGRPPFAGKGQFGTPRSPGHQLGSAAGWSTKASSLPNGFYPIVAIREILPTQSSSNRRIFFTHRTLSEASKNQNVQVLGSQHSLPQNRSAMLSAVVNVTSYTLPGKTEPTVLGKKYIWN